ncbi:cyclin-O protein B-like isoform X2 [Mercenaria mercenaria]|uniref:cyclin-O protein B-like isoform X2 n=1 Tax=Mercenaria mercenaria TaxID=6596 RepID=UPI001E1DA811|nr:cyclin-O protein B-like isoform X2 [Mercenaria mercenaria]
MSVLLDAECLQEPEYILENDIIAGKSTASGDMDEGIECGYSKIYEIVEESVQTTPDVISVSSSLCDSGFTESVNDKLNLHCLECVIDLPPKKSHRDGVVQCTCSNMEHDGFEDYVSEIYLHRLSLEEKYHVPACLDNQPEVSTGVRRVLIQWLTSVHHSLKLCQDTLYLAVNIIDRVLDVMQVSRDCLELLGVTCLLVASKQNEICPPEIHELLEKCEDTFTREQVKQLEMIVLMATSFDLLAPTVQQFLEYFASFCLAMCAADEEQTYRMARAVGRCLLELTLQDYEFCQFRPSLLALCVWKASVEHLKTYDGNFIPPGMTIVKQHYDLCLAEVHLFIDNFRQSCPDITSVCEKYADLYGQK